MRVVGAVVSAGAAASSAPLNSKGGGAGTAIAGLISRPINGTAVLPPDANYCQTKPGDALTVATVGAGPAAITVIYQLVS
jgi:hypothetical protein